MKKLFLIWALILCGCAKTGYDGKTYWPWQSVPPPPPPEKICKDGTLEFQIVHIIQLTNDAIFVDLQECSNYDKSDKVCESWRIHDIDGGDRLAIKRENWKNVKEDLYDDKSILLGTKCATLKGTYSYTNTLGAQKTIRKISAIGDPILNPAFKEWQAAQKTDAKAD